MRYNQGGFTLMKLKKALVVFITLIIATTIFAGCSKKPSKYAQGEKKPLEVPESFYSEEDGIEFQLPELWKENFQYLNSVSIQKGQLQGFEVSGGAQFLFLPKEAMDAYLKEIKAAESIGDRNQAVNTVLSESRRLCLIIGFEQKSIEDKDISTFTGFKINEKIANNGGFNYYLCYDEHPETLGLSKTSKRIYETLHKGIPDIKKTFRPFEPILGTVDEGKS